jgi:hypothetical protein
VDLAGLDLQVDALEDLLALDGRRAGFVIF